MNRAVHSDIAIIGGGLAGQMMARTLSGTGYDVVLIDKPASAALYQTDYRTTTIHAAGKRMLDALGVWDKLAIAPEPIDFIKVGQNQTENRWPLCFSAQEIALAYTVQNQALADALKQYPCTRQDGIIDTIDFGADKPNWQFKDGTKGSADLIIGCDGANSFTRQQARLPVWKRHTNQTAIIAHIHAETHHKQTAFQRFLPEGPLAFMPLADNMLSLVWSLSEASAERLLSCDKKLFETELNAAFGPELGHLSLSDGEGGIRQTWPLRPTIVPHLTAKGLILAGDAAHALHPLAGMGFNLALADMAVLADCLVSAKQRGLIAGHNSILSDYAHRRRPEIVALSAVTEGLNRLFSHSSTTKNRFGARQIATLAGWGMQLVGKSRLDTQISRLAMGGVLSPAQLLDGKLPWAH